MLKPEGKSRPRNFGAGWRVEFGLSAGYPGLDTSEDSSMAGHLAALRNENPAWTWFDVKAALRLCAQSAPGALDTPFTRDRISAGGSSQL
jgi:hypothetical protein